jgi:hypothetical protein
MQETAIAHVDADVVDAALAAEEHQVTRGQRGAVVDQFGVVIVAISRETRGSSMPRAERNT